MLSILAFFAAIVLLAGAYIRHNRLKKLPPGPPANSLLGNKLPDAFAYRFFEHWTQEYGPVFSIRQGFDTIVVIGRYDAAVELMEKEGSSLADRPRHIAAGDTLSGGMRMLLTPQGERFNKMRRALRSHLQPKSVQDYEDVLHRAALVQLSEISQNPDRHLEFARKYAASVVMSLAYGPDKIPQSYDDPEVQSVNRCLTRLGLAMRPGVWKVDTFPFLRYIPGYLNQLREGHAEELGLFKRLLQEVRDAPVPPPCFGSYLIEQQEQLGLNDSEVSYLAGSMFGAGSDTTASAISVAIMAAATHPEAQAAVREELRALGRPPKMSDKDALPRTSAFVTESFRWRPITSGGFPHRASKDLYWNGYVIPAGTTVIGNVWSVGRDPAYFPDPEAFDPSRWLTDSGELRTDLKSYPFGFGRRVCPGQHLATASVFLNTALILYYFKLAEDEKKPIDVLAFTESANAAPLPFDVVFTPTEGEHAWDATREAIRQELAMAA
ncbi:cytochrome P450 [Cylindrobasidium torrendii FP15055 ss-10]|uniref:Cytochrome P450 n=1 Tax=Cylindrobasidium torrendii FP15055 ss-10 TaxID=1314674 RepID=A0A0D7BRK9_9AGAR|nr:cytochrome P450 [Cylindrobasidium torrendii FP15055 ss-10]